MAQVPDPIEALVGFLAHAISSPLTTKSYRVDRTAFAAWFEKVNGEPMAPAQVTLTAVKQYKRWLAEQRWRKPKALTHHFLPK